jgi:hypothetical protein
MNAQQALLADANVIKIKRRDEYISYLTTLINAVDYPTFEEFSKA